MNARTQLRDIQLEFVCQECGLEGLTPDVTRDEGRSLLSGTLQLRCPACSAVLAVRPTPANWDRVLRGPTVSEMKSAISEQIEAFIEERRQQAPGSGE